jgi:hypothetical protein
MSVVNQVIQNAIDTLIFLTGKSGEFKRVCAEIERVNQSMPNAIGDDKFKKVKADAAIIFDDLVVPLLKRELNMLIELGVFYLTLQNPVAGEIAGSVAGVVEESLQKNSA